jgi:hypothetical protein
MFSFLKKKDNAEDTDTKVNLNFVTPAPKDVAPEKANRAENDVTTKKVEPDYFDEEDSDIERLISDYAVKAPAEVQSPSVVDLTADKILPSKAKNVVSAAKRPRKTPASKKKIPVVSISSVLTSMTPVAKNSITEETETSACIESADAAIVSVGAVDPVTAASEELSAAAETPAECESTVVKNEPAQKTPAPTKKRVRKASVKKVESAESVALDPESAAEGVEGTESAESTVVVAPAAVEEPSAEVKSAPKRAKKPVAKPMVTEIVFPPHVLVKRQTNKDKLTLLVAELQQLERYTR